MLSGNGIDSHAAHSTFRTGSPWEVTYSVITWFEVQHVLVESTRPVSQQVSCPPSGVNKIPGLSFAVKGERGFKYERNLKTQLGDF